MHQGLVCSLQTSQVVISLSEFTFGGPYISLNKRSKVEAGQESAE